MIIKIGLIELSEWTNQPQPDLKGYPISGDLHRLFNTLENEWKIGVSLKPRPFEDKIWYAMFYYQFCSLHEVFPSNFEAKDIKFAKNYVDNFLIKMSNLTVFL